MLILNNIIDKVPSDVEIKQLDRFIETWQKLTSCQLVEVTVEESIELKTVQ